jgi:lipopolysaccharide transport system ATP-binding protein
MMVVSVENVSKAYRLGAIGGSTLQEDFERWWARLRGKPDPLLKVGRVHDHSGSHEQFWALQDVSFQVQQGEALGIIGRNGAGKSTLLKILSQVTGPTRGQVKVKGRIASLLEVGTGFHSELTGRENIFLNGAILGMTKAEIRRKLDEIIAFSGVEEFIDTPVKRYSSGMNVRLAFAVAAHLEPEILVVDEVLAVGDAEFQKKCLGKMSDVARGGRTILFVSHDLGAVSRLCQRGILLNKGRVEAADEIAKIIARYTAEDAGVVAGFADLSKRGDRTGTGDAQFRSIELLRDSERTGVFEFGFDFSVRLEVSVRHDIGSALIAVTIFTASGVAVHEMHNADARYMWRASPGFHTLTVTVPQLRLYPGDYVVDLWMGDSRSSRVDYLRDCARFQVVQTTASGLDRTLDSTGGVMYQPSEWSQTLA